MEDLMKAFESLQGDLWGVWFLIGWIQSGDLRCQYGKTAAPERRREGNVDEEDQEP